MKNVENEPFRTRSENKPTLREEYDAENQCRGKKRDREREREREKAREKSLVC